MYLLLHNKGSVLVPLQGSDNVSLVFPYIPHGGLSAENKMTELGENRHIIRENALPLIKHLILMSSCLALGMKCLS